MQEKKRRKSYLSYKDETRGQSSPKKKGKTLLYCGQRKSEKTREKTEDEDSRRPKEKGPRERTAYENASEKREKRGQGPSGSR